MRKTDHPLYTRWYGLIRRCEQPSSRDYARYGARGITLCEAWHDFWVFVRDVGVPPTPTAQLDRVDNSRGYEPGNVVWAEPGENNRNRGVSRYSALPPLAPQVTEARLATFYGVSRSSVESRLTAHGFRASALCGLAPGVDSLRQARESWVIPVPPFAPAVSAQALGTFYGVTKQAILYRLRTRGRVGSSLAGLTKGGGSVFGPRRSPAPSV